MTLHLDPERLQRSNLLPVRYEIQEAYRQPNRFWGLNAFQFSDMANELAWSGRQFFGQLAVEGDFLPPVLMLDGYIKALCLDTRQFIHDLSGVYRPNPFRHHDPLSCFTTELRSGKDVWSPMHNSQRIATFHERFAKTGDLEELKRQCRSVLRLIGFAEEEHAIDWRIAMDLQYLCHYMVQSVLKANEGKLDEAVEKELRQVETQLIDYLEKRGMYYPSGVLPQHVGYQEEMAAQREEERIKQADVARRNQAKADAASDARRANKADNNTPEENAASDSTNPSTTTSSASTEDNNVDAPNVTPPPYQRKYWIEALLRDQDNRSIPNQNWWIQTPDGATHTGITDDFGRVRLEGITQSGRCLIKFPGVNALKNGKTPPPSGDTSTTSYTVKQGDTLLRIAKAHGLGSADDIYLHEENAEFREKRPNPNVINPGDVVAVPKASDEPFEERTGYSHRFVVSRQQEVFRTTLRDAKGQPLKGKRVVLNMGSQMVEQIIGADGVFEAPINAGTSGTLELYLNEQNPEDISHAVKIEMSSLDPHDTLSGVQARCNNLGFDCGVVDGINGRRTREGVREFQATHGLDVDGVAGPKTKGKLLEVYGF